MLNKKQLDQFTKEFEIKAKSVLLINKKNCVTLIINGVIIFNIEKELVKNYI